MNLNMRWMMKKDVKSIIRIQDCSFNSTKFDKKFFSSVVSSRKNFNFGFKDSNSFISYVCELDKKVVGYIVYKVGILDFDKCLHSSNMEKYKNSFPMCGEIISFCVEESFRLNKIGSFLVQSVINRFSSVVEFSLKESFSRPYILYAVSSEKDLGSHLFFKKLGFKGKSIFWNFFGEDHDGYAMVYEDLASKKFFDNSFKGVLK